MNFESIFLTLPNLWKRMMVWLSQLTASVMFNKTPHLDTIVFKSEATEDQLFYYSLYKVMPQFSCYLMF